MKFNRKGGHMAKVLIIESDEGTRFLYKTALSFQKLEAIAVAKASEALEVIQKESVDLVLLDVMTPDLKDINIIKELQEKTKEKLPLIIITDLREKDILQEKSIFGACEFLTKGQDSVGDVIRKVRDVINE